MLLESLTRRGVSLRVRGERVEWRPRPALSDAERAALRSQEQAIATLLAANGGAVAPQVGHLEGRERWVRDPRPDLADTFLWGALLARAYDLDGHDPAGLFGALHGLRCCGAQLVAGNGAVRLVAGELGDEYPALRRAYLEPHAEALTALLTRLAPQRRARHA